MVDYEECKDADLLIPLIRTTTSYEKPVQRFSPLIYDLVCRIRQSTCMPSLRFNNALLEVYDSSYRNMGWHSDQALDLADDSCICLYSCYDTDTLPEKRVLKIKEKPRPAELVSEKKEEAKSMEFVLDHQSIVMFSTATNRAWLHKITLAPPLGRSQHPPRAQQQWLGLTLRLSKTFIQFQEAGSPQLYPSKTKLTRATDEELKESRRHKALENASADFSYPPRIAYSTSRSDFIPLLTTPRQTTLRPLLHDHTAPSPRSHDLTTASIVTTVPSPHSLRP